MGCEQSSERKVTPEPSRWTSRVLSSRPAGQRIQTIVNGNNTEKTMEATNNSNNNMNGQASEKIRELLRDYQNKEMEINEIEKGEPLTMYYIKKSHLESINRRIADQEKKIAALENGDGDSTKSSRCTSVKSVLIKFGDRKLNKEDHEILAISNKLEIAQAELEMSHQEKALVENEVANLHSTLLGLRDAYRQQDDLLEKLSMNGETVEESTLQTELADLEIRRMKISEIYERWKEGRQQVCESCRQFSSALKKWRSLPADSTNHLDEYDMGEDIRDDLVNAIQCLQSTKFYIRLHELPYCSTAEVGVLEKALTYLFIDLRSVERRHHAELCYAAIHKRATALFAWIEQTLSIVIEPDLARLTNLINDKANSLKSIRAEEIRKKYPGVNVTNRIYNSEETIPLRLADLDSQSIFSALDGETEKIFSSLQFDQLAPLPSIEEISVTSKNTDDLIQSVKLELRQEFAKKQSSSQSNVDEILGHRRNTLSRKLLLIEDSFR